MKETNNASLVWKKGSLGKERLQKKENPPRLLFAQVREDASCELELLSSLKNPKQVLAIGSGGCTAFSLLLANPETLFALDINAAQIYLMELKKAALLSLPYDTMRFSFSQDARIIYSKLHPLLSPEAQKFWKTHLHLLSSGINQSGIIDKSLRFAIRLFRLFVHSKRIIQKFFDSKTLSSQKEFYQKFWNTWRWKTIFSFGLSRPVLRLVYGKEALSQLPENFSSLMKHQMEEVLTKFPISENPYLWQLFLFGYPTQENGLPPYLQKNTQRVLTKNLSKMHFVHEEVSAWLAKQNPNTIDFFALSNILEVSSNEFVKCLVQSITKTATPRALICLRFILPPKPWLKSLLEKQFQVETDISKNLQAKERSPFCRFFLVLRIKQPS